MVTDNANEKHDLIRPKHTFLTIHMSPDLNKELNLTTETSKISSLELKLYLTSVQLFKYVVLAC